MTAEREAEIRGIARLDLHPGSLEQGIEECVADLLAELDAVRAEHKQYVADSNGHLNALRARMQEREEAGWSRVAIDLLDPDIDIGVVRAAIAAAVKEARAISERRAGPWKETAPNVWARHGPADVVVGAWGHGDTWHWCMYGRLSPGAVRDGSLGAGVGSLDQAKAAADAALLADGWMLQGDRVAGPWRDVGQWWREAGGRGGPVVARVWVPDPRQTQQCAWVAGYPDGPNGQGVAVTRESAMLAADDWLAADGWTLESE